MSDKIRRILNHESPDIILNLAAYTNVEKAEEQREIAFAVNGDALTQICSEISVYNSKQNKNLPLIHFSTDYVFDGGGVEPIRPCARMNPLNVYGQSKAEGEKNILSSPISYLIFRTSWVVSKYRNNFVKTILRKTQQKYLQISLYVALSLKLQDVNLNLQEKKRKCLKQLPMK